MKKFLCLLFVITLLVSCLASCNVPADNGNTPDNSEDGSTTPTTEGTKETETEATAPKINTIDDLSNCENVVSVTKLSENTQKGYLIYELVFLSENLKITADVALPDDYASKKYPIVFYLPEINVTPEGLVSQFVANNIIAVRLYERGMGKSEGTRNFGGTDYLDVIEAERIISQVSCLSENEKILAGSSTGSILALRAASESDRFDGCAVIDTISDIQSFVDARGQAIAGLFASGIGKTIEEAPEEYEKRSAVHFASKLNLSVLIIAYRNHPLCPEEQATALHEKLQQEGKTSEIFFIDELSSDFNQTAQNKLLSWMHTVN